MLKSMATTTCKECGKELSTTAKTCPHCGSASPRKSSGCLPVTIIFVILLIFTGFVGECFKRKPEIQPVATSSDKVVQDHEQPTIDPAEKIRNDDQILTNMEANRKRIQANLKKYYASSQDMIFLQANVLTLEVVKESYKNSSAVDGKKLYKKATTILPKMETTLRQVFASSLQEVFMKSGLNIHASVVGKTKQTLRLEYALMSDPFVYRLQNTENLDDKARDAGFKKMILTNGFGSSLGSTWTINL